jgi:hypothetical protein
MLDSSLQRMSFYFYFYARRIHVASPNDSQSFAQSRGAMWDVSAAGPLGGSMAAAAVMAIGLLQSQPGLLPKVRRDVHQTREVDRGARHA